MQELLSSIRRNAVGLALFAMVTAGAIAVTQVLTKERIARNVLEAEAKALNDIVPQSDYDNDLLTDVIALDQRFNLNLLGLRSEDQVAHLARNDGQVSTVILPVVAPDGYTTAIRLLVGIHADGRIAGVRVVEHKETPGLGDKIDHRKSDWIFSFDGTSLFDTLTWAVKKDGGDFDQFTGATITPRAVVAAVHQALQFFQQHQASLLNPGPAAAAQLSSGES
ncbi:electron transport complex subunit RsxG [Bacterioplanes sanyensis]|uniref:Ion-translocating oxidoreductase complex subunit G n=1 Tax=Bacterioplanes sanyensis TaxID=1249553 RepID=A0A222FM91_9GAMM|nr:electron transport complex subunit RsxG [Bacterioplanes sanyensis]ASP40138.1 electron transport complex subunit RsxG [Bacterioplanes sanyensis]